MPARRRVPAVSETTVLDRLENLREEAPVDFYEGLYEEEGAYDRPYQSSHYYPLFRTALAEVQRLGGQRILEVGCGSGSFAHLLFDRTELAYIGFDYAKAAVEKAKRRTRRTVPFFVGNALAPESYAREYDTIVCTEVLEHVEQDLDVIAQWRSGSKCVCSVPNFDIPDQHVRFFRAEDEVRSRYGRLIRIDRITRVPRSVLRGRTFAEYFRRLRWSRNDAKRFLAMLGYRTFDNLAGWYVFSGHRTN